MLALAYWRKLRGRKDRCHLGFTLNIQHREGLIISMYDSSHALDVSLNLATIEKCSASRPHRLPTSYVDMTRPSDNRMAACSEMLEREDKMDRFMVQTALGEERYAIN